MSRLIVVEGSMVGLSFDLGEETVFIGRSSTNDIQIKDSAVSRKQLKIFTIGKKIFVEDLKSTNGTSINDELITPGEGFEIAEEDKISIGNTVLKLVEVSTKSQLDVKTLTPSKSDFDGEATERFPSERRSPTPNNLELLSKVSELLRQSLSLNDLLAKTLDHLMETLPRIDRAAILLFDKENGDIKEVVSKSKNDPWDEAVRYSRSIVGRVLEEGKAVRMSNTDYEAPEDFSESIRHMKIRSAMCVPVISNSEMRGALYVDSIQGPYGFRKEDLLLLNSLSGPMAVAIENQMLASTCEAPSEG
jgi:pSer/pThr/pTyr-binding forkhead associated (FHA) protein